jgi:hypothetical protein
MDLIALGVILGFFAVAVGYVAFCQRVVGSAEDQDHSAE